MTGADVGTGALLRLCTAGGVVPGAVGMLIRPDDDEPVLAVVGGWPPELVGGPFGLMRVSAEGAAGQVLRPASAHVYRVEDGDPSRSIAVVEIVDAVGLTGPQAPRGSKDQVVGMVEDSRDLLGTLAKALPQPYEDLIGPLSPLTTALDEKTVLDSLVEAPIELHAEPAPAAAQGICSWLHWD